MTLKDELISYMAKHTNQEAANYFSVNVRTIARWLNKYGLTYYELKHGNKPKCLSELQKDVFHGTMLGDANIVKDGRYRFKQCVAHEEYVKHIHEIMAPFSCNIISDWNKKPSNTNNKVIDLETWNGEWLESKYFVTIRSPLFKIERKRWYVGSKKIIPEDLELNPRICAYWCLDDGCNRQSRRQYILSTQGFKVNEVDRLRSMIAKMGIKASIQIKDSGPIIFISAHSYFDWIDLIKPYVKVDCLKRKIDTDKASCPKKGYGPKLNYKKAQEIKRQYATDKYTQKALAAIYDVTEATIWRIINDKIYHKVNPGFGGSADVALIFKA